MGYFPNGTSGEIYEQEYCSRCKHQDAGDGCPIWTLHLLWNYEAVNEKNKKQRLALDLFIPRDSLGYNKQCVMFCPSDAAQKEQELEKLKKWNNTEDGAGPLRLEGI